MAVRVGLSSYPPVPVVAGSKWPDICGKLRPQIQANELLSTHTINVERVSQENADAEKQAGRRKGGIVWTLTVARSHAHARRLRNLTGEKRGSCV